MMLVHTLTCEDVLQVHQLLVEEFERSGDRISPASLKEPALLESAVGRQHVGFGGKRKYDTPELSAATLTYGICNNHAFHNGNKRTALVSMLLHLERNGLQIVGTAHDEVLCMILAVAEHHMSATKRSKRSGEPSRGEPDEEVAAIAKWIRDRKPTKGESQIPFRQLRQILKTYDFELEVVSGNRADVVRYQSVKKMLGFRTERVRKRFVQIGYHDEGTVVSVKDLKAVRRECCLTPEHGVDSKTFYSAQAVVDSFMAQYRTILRKLARL
ncbi:MAG: type II toxin-antitoxin system death-on-curing family toxin [Phycisphaerae bacterium]|jgi:death-on-curing family protein